MRRVECSLVGKIIIIKDMLLACLAISGTITARMCRHCSFGASALAADWKEYMARSLPKQAVAAPRRASWAKAQELLGALRLWPPLLLTLLTLGVLMIAYAVRPTVRIDLGDTFDVAYLQDFNGREIDAVGVPEEAAWATDQPSVTIPGDREGVWLATLHVADDQPDGALERYAVAVNDVRVMMPRRGPRELLATIPPELVAAEHVTFQLVPGVVGGPEPPTGLVDRVTLAQARTYRWSSDESTVWLPGLGRGDWLVTLSVVVAHPIGRAHV